MWGGLLDKFYPYDERIVEHDSVTTLHIGEHESSSEQNWNRNGHVVPNCHQQGQSASILNAYKANENPMI
ncbi:hypothetical protein EG68_01930 [Paragonimus skrjabini miyazakii]|uniref:Uncharacterized protein n=1 Tax=Paragonimus skrjabini miyazakii TaxID=59628 RepID=A0A8S9Z548_9TREM|nr:hypothetical protein EG68_01930 [Paragonimus skrjabini miyazakii]